jgi:heme/copper-type cytochrome/quinol oxidase subunit 2
MTIARIVRMPAVGVLLLPRVALLTASAMAALIVGCATPEPTATPAAKAPAATPATTAARTVDIQLVEWDVVANPPSIAAGNVRFAVTNAGSVTHAFEINWPAGLVFTENIPPGGTDSLEMPLDPGTYTLICPIPGHADRGMRTEFTVN